MQPSLWEWRYTRIVSAYYELKESLRNSARQLGRNIKLMIDFVDYWIRKREKVLLSLYSNRC